MPMTPGFFPHSSPFFHHAGVKEVGERKCLLNKDSLSLHIHLSTFHPTPLAMTIFACAREGWVKGERRSSGLARRRARHVGAGSNISGAVGQGCGRARGANVGAHLAQFHNLNGSFPVAGAVTAAGTVAVLEIA